MIVTTDPDKDWIFECDGLNTHKSESLVKFVAEACHLNVDQVKKAAQGSSISPTLTNLTLDGLEDEIEKRYFPTKKNKFSRHQQYNPNLINIARYDDFVITANNKEVLLEIMG